MVYSPSTGICKVFVDFFLSDHLFLKLLFFILINIVANMLCAVTNVTVDVVEICNKKKSSGHKLNGNVRKNYLFKQRKSPCVFVVVEPDFPKTPSSDLDRKSLILHQSHRIFRYGTVASLSVLRLLYVSDVIFCTMQNF